MNSERNDKSKGSIEGRVTTTDNKAVEDAYVTISGQSPEHHDIAAVTNDNGEYVLDDLSPGNYEVLANAEGYSPQTKSTKVHNDQVTTLNFEVE